MFFTFYTFSLFTKLTAYISCGFTKGLIKKSPICATVGLKRSLEKKNASVLIAYFLDEIKRRAKDRFAQGARRHLRRLARRPWKNRTHHGLRNLDVPPSIRSVHYPRPDEPCDKQSLVEMARRRWRRGTLRYIRYLAAAAARRYVRAYTWAANKPSIVPENGGERCTGDANAGALSALRHTYFRRS